MLIGTSTSAHQVEGNNKRSDWWHFENLGKLPFKSGSGCGQYNHYREDISIMKKLHLNAYRFSIEMARVFPKEGKVDVNAIRHYKRLISDLNDAGIEPIPTLWHYTLPLWFYRMGGFEKRANFKHFKNYVSALLSEGLDVKYVLTINEPVIYAFRSYVMKEYPPFRGSLIRFFPILDNLLELHNEVYDMLKPYGYKVSFANNFIKFGGDVLLYPLAAALDYIFNRKPMVYTKFDFVGVNYYRSVSPVKFILSKLTPRKKIWLVDPDGLEKTLEEQYTMFGKPVMITENGVSTMDENFRAKFIKTHFASVLSAKRKGVPVLGYLYWSLLDNFEWNYGYNETYGLVSFDQKTKKRTIKPSASALADIAKKYGR